MDIPAQPSPLGQPPKPVSGIPGIPPKPDFPPIIKPSSPLGSPLGDKPLSSPFAPPKEATEPPSPPPPPPSTAVHQSGVPLLLIIVVLLLVGIIGGGVYFLKSRDMLNFGPFGSSALTPTPTPGFIAPTLAPTATPTATPVATWKTYKQITYGFEFDYPGKGVSPKGGVEECGLQIKEDRNLALDPKYPALVIDNFFLIKITDWSKTIDEYIAGQNAVGLYNTSPISNSNADEAIAIGALKTSWSGTEPAPLSDVHLIYKKDTKLFLIVGIKNPGLEGCLPPGAVGSAEHPDLDATKNWDLTASFKFIP